ncbi:O-antigen ligase family protein [Microvirga makkahensis]|uniref:O-antigen ligase domain-containing protein n=1 Tax=Microvirga makkahensis TaxID=1128670 RepID=A0A7X3MUN2_9HYPH|nr:O-antigen ligase family protein [Microvirga makkahensis]MXQ13568.1 O-antigen ligase domain-containing protein [Microvirga makkahensis]
MEPSVPTFSPYIVGGIYLALLPLIFVALFRYKDASTRFLIFALWLRYLLSAFHPFTYPPVAGGLSLNAIASIALTAIGFLVIERRLLLLKAFGGVYLVIVATMVSASINDPASAVGSLTKWGYFLVLTAAAFEALGRHGSSAVFGTLIVAFLPPLALQVLSVAMGLGKFSISDSSICYIGGYNHEAAFSIIMLTFLYCSFFLESDRPFLTAICVPIALMALLLANYRTSLLAAIPITVAAPLIGAVRRVSPTDRPFVLIVFALAGTMLFYAAAIVLQERFDDLFLTLANLSDLVKPPEYYTTSDEELLSARAVIWSRYVTSYLDGSILNLAFGFGPDSWEGVFTRYAHNTFISSLYESGSVGLVSMIVLFVSNIRFALRSVSQHRLLVVSAHAGFLILNLATMPLWLIEGNILLALTLAYTLHVQAPRRLRVSRMPRATAIPVLDRARLEHRVRQR